MDIKESINDTRKGFEESFASGDFYNRQTRDSEHLARNTSICNFFCGIKYLDSVLCSYPFESKEVINR